VSCGLKIKGQKTRALYQLVIAATTLFILKVPLVSSMDALILNGIVKNIDYKSGIVTIDVKSESCQGIRSFKIDAISKLDSSLIGKEISFPISSSSCEDDKKHKMILPQGKEQ